MEEPEYDNRKRVKAILFFVRFFCCSTHDLLFFSKNPCLQIRNYTYFFFYSLPSACGLPRQFPPFAVGLFIMAFLVFALGNKNFNSAPENIEKYVNTFSSSVIWLMLGGFFLASAMTKTNLDESLVQVCCQDIRNQSEKPHHRIDDHNNGCIYVDVQHCEHGNGNCIRYTIVTFTWKKIRAHQSVAHRCSHRRIYGRHGYYYWQPTKCYRGGALENAGIKIDFLNG